MLRVGCRALHDVHCLDVAWQGLPQARLRVASGGASLFTMPAQVFGKKARLGVRRRDQVELLVR